MIENHMVRPASNCMPTRLPATIYDSDFWHDNYGMLEEMSAEMAYLMIFATLNDSGSVMAIVKRIHDEALKIQGEE